MVSTLIIAQKSYYETPALLINATDYMVLTLSIIKSDESPMFRE